MKKFASILACFMLLTLCGRSEDGNPAPEGTTSGGGTAKSLDYGHWLVFDDDAKMDIHGDKSIVDIIKKGANPNIKGLKLKYLWKDLEPRRGEYDFSAIERDLNYCKSLGRKMIMLLMDKTFDENLRYLPAYLDKCRDYSDTCLYIQGSTGGWTPVRWSPLYIERLDSLMTAMARKFDSDPWFEGVSFQETAISVPVKDRNATPYIPFEEYTDDKYNAALKTIVINTAKAFKNSGVFWQMNGMGTKNDYDYFKEDIELFIPYRNIVIVVNDLLPYRKKGADVGYPLCAEFKGRIPLGGAAAYSAHNTHIYDTVSSPRCDPPIDPVTGKAVYASMQDIFDFATRELFVQFIFWKYVPGKSSGNRTDPDDLTIIAKYPVFNKEYQIR